MLQDLIKWFQEYQWEITVILGAGVGCWLFAVVVTAIFGRFAYPPRVARVGCWLGTATWTVVLLWVILDPEPWLIGVIIGCAFILSLFMLVNMRRARS